MLNFFLRLKFKIRRNVPTRYIQEEVQGLCACVEKGSSLAKFVSLEVPRESIHSLGAQLAQFLAESFQSFLALLRTSCGPESGSKAISSRASLRNKF